MLKKISFYIFIAFALALAVWGYFRLKENKEPAITATEHIPSDAHIVFKTNSVTDFINQFTRQNLIWNSLKKDSMLAISSSSIHFLDSIIKIDADVASVFNNNSFYACFFENVKQTNYLFVLKAKEKSNNDLFKTFFEERFKRIAITDNSTSYEIKHKKNTWYVSYYNGLLFLSDIKSLIQKAIQLPTNQSIANNENYKKLIESNGAQNELFYVNKNNHSLFSALPLLNEAIYHSTIKPNEITLNGYAINNNNSQLFQNQKATVIDAFRNLPAQPSTIMGIAVSNPLLYEECFLKNLNQQEQNSINQSWNVLADSASYPIKKEFLENINEQIVSCYYENNSQLLCITAIKIKDEELMESLLKLANDSVYKQNEQTIFHIAPQHQLSFSFIQSSQKNVYALISDNLLVLANNKQVINFYQESILAKNIINKDIDMMTYVEDNFSEACHILHFNNCSKLSTQSANYFILNPNSVFTKQQAIQKVSYTAKQQASHWQLRVNALQIQKTNLETIHAQNNLWEFQADSSIITEPYLFTNHITNEKEICFQTNDKELHLLNAIGNVIWKKKINETIQSTIYAVDIFKNGKFQLLFNTENYLHLVDRNGNYVQGYPIKLPAKVTSNITLFDYDNNKDYRILIACSDNRIYNYSIYGIKTEGFVPFKTTHQVELPIKYIKVGLSDYLITIDAEGKIYAFSRKGEGRIALTNRTTTQLQNFDIVAGSSLSNTKLIYIDDKDKLLNKISLTDKKETSKIGDDILGFNTHFDFMNDDEQLDILCFGDGAIFGYDLFSNQLLEYFSEASVFDDVQIINSSNGNKYIAFDKAMHKIDVLNTESKLVTIINNVTKAPLIKELFNDGKKYIICVNNKIVSCKVLN